MRLVARSDKIIPKGDHTLIIMQDGGDRHAVCVQGAALSEELISHMSEIERIASLKLEAGELAFDGRVWIVADDILGTPRRPH